MDINEGVVVSNQGLAMSQKGGYLAIFMTKVNALMIILMMHEEKKGLGCIGQRGAHVPKGDSS